MDHHLEALPYQPLGKPDLDRTEPKQHRPSLPSPPVSPWQSTKPGLAHIEPKESRDSLLHFPAVSVDPPRTRSSLSELDDEHLANHRSLRHDPNLQAYTPFRRTGRRPTGQGFRGEQHVPGLFGENNEGQQDNVSEKNGDTLSLLRAVRKFFDQNPSHVLQGDQPTRHIQGKLQRLKRGVPGYVNGKRITALPDTGSAQNVVSAAFVKEHGLQIQRSQEDFKLGNSTITKSCGNVPLISILYVDFREPGFGQASWT